MSHWERPAIWFHDDRRQWVEIQNLTEAATCLHDDTYAISKKSDIQAMNPQYEALEAIKKFREPFKAEIEEFRRFLAVHDGSDRGRPTLDARYGNNASAKNELMQAFAKAWYWLGACWHMLECLKHNELQSSRRRKQYINSLHIAINKVESTYDEFVARGKNEAAASNEDRNSRDLDYESRDRPRIGWKSEGKQRMDLVRTGQYRSRDVADQLASRPADYDIEVHGEMPVCYPEGNDVSHVEEMPQESDWSSDD